MDHNDFLSPLLDMQREHIKRLLALEAQGSREYCEIRFTEGALLGVTQVIDLLRAQMQPPPACEMCGAEPAQQKKPRSRIQTTLREGK